jgi:diamine N-acetyltransferase
MSVSLNPVTGENLFDCIHLMTSVEQWEAYLEFARLTDERFVASNLVSLAQAGVHRELVPLAIYDGETPVGFVMYEPLAEENNTGYHICRLMVGYPYQGKGFGRAGMEAVIAHLRGKPDCHRITTSVLPENVVADALYRRLGFVPTGDVDDGEIVLCLETTEHSPS